MSNPRPGSEEFDEEELIRIEFESMVSGLSLDESAPSTYLEELERIEAHDGFIAPNPPRQSIKEIFRSAQLAIRKWFYRGYHDDDGAEV